MQTKRILRSRNDRMIAGVAGGLANYFGVDPLIVRIALLVLAFFNGLGTLIYLTLWLLVPNEDSAGDTRSNVQESLNEMQTAIEQLIARVRGAFTR
jgi:phage shock protein C